MVPKVTTAQRPVSGLARTHDILMANLNNSNKEPARALVSGGVVGSPILVLDFFCPLLSPA